MHREDEMLARLEVALYASGRPLSLEEIQSAIGTESRSKALKVARMLAERVNSTFHALEVVESPSGSFVLQIKPSYYSMVRRFSTRPLLSKAVLRTLAYIAYMQPVNAKRLAEVRGSQVYEHLRELRAMGFISYSIEGRRSRMYRTTSKFAEYFGIDGDGSEGVRSLLVSRVDAAGAGAGAGDGRGKDKDRDRVRGMDAHTTSDLADGITTIVAQGG